MFNIIRQLLIAVLIVIIVVGGIVAWSRYSRSQPVEIALAPQAESEGEIYVGGNVSNPGYYPFKASDSLEAIVQAAGGAGADAQLKLYVAQAEEGQPQKINLNRAEAWLLAALPDIGQARAQAIIDYRRKNGPFRDTSELLKVEGIGAANYEKIKRLITVAD